MFWKRITVGDNTRVLVIRNGRFARILEPGDYRLFRAFSRSIETESHNLRDVVFASQWADFLATERPAIATRFFTVVETGDSQVAIVSLDGKVFRVVGPAKRVLFWRGVGAIAVEIVNGATDVEVPAEKLSALERLGRESLVTVATVEDSRAGLLYIDNRFVRTLGPGKYGFWTAAGSIRVE